MGTVVPVTPKQEAQIDVPAGYRVPKPFKKTYVDKIPEWIDTCKQDGKSEQEILQMLRQKEIKYISKWGNKSKVGAIINDYNKELLECQPVDSVLKTAGGERPS